MQHKGYLTDTGRVVQKTKSPIDPGHRRSGHKLSLDGDQIIGEVGYHETHYNLRRLYVHRKWIVRLDDGSKFERPTRTAAVNEAMAHRIRDQHDQGPFRSRTETDHG